MKCVDPKTGLTFDVQTYSQKGRSTIKVEVDARIKPPDRSEFFDVRYDEDETPTSEAEQ